jgi:hypothetical protein
VLARTLSLSPSVSKVGLHLGDVTFEPDLESVSLPHPQRLGGRDVARSPFIGRSIRAVITEALDLGPGTPRTVEVAGAKLRLVDTGWELEADHRERDLGGH